MRRGRRPAIGILLAGLLLPGASVAQTAPATACHQGISAETSARLFNVLSNAPPGAHCAFRGVNTEKSVLEATWSAGDHVLPPLQIFPAGCAPAGSTRRGDFDIVIPGALTAVCPEVAGIADLLGPSLAQEAPVRETNASPPLTDPLLVACEIAFGLVILLTGVVAIRSSRPQRSFWIALGAVGFIGALTIRAAVPFSMGNWYEEVLPATGPPPWMRFGPGAFALQLLLRSIGLWNPHTLRISQLVLGSLAVPILVEILRELRVSNAAIIATAILFIFAPFHVRLSATGSAHVLASTCALGMLWAWLSATRTGDPWAFALTLLLFGLTILTRVDMIVQASLLALWPLLRDPKERGTRFPAVMLPIFVAIGLMIVGVAYTQVIVPSHHPRPDFSVTGAIVQHQLVQQFWTLARQPPQWFSLSAVLLAIIGVPWMAWRRPRLLARAGATVALAFLGLCRTFLHDELVGARYFLAIIPIFLILSGFGFEALLSLVPKNARGPAAAAGALVLALWTGLSARNAYAARYAFQDEYSFAQDALRKLPDGCTVYELSMRPGQIPHDLDCCLDVPRSPLALEFPKLRFEPMPEQKSSVFEEGSCHAYYESIACDFKQPASGIDRDAISDELFRKECADVRGVGHFRPLAEATTSPRATFPYFAGGAPHVRLYEWTR